VLGALLDKYRVVEKLGEGGMGVVFVGRHETLNHRVVVKVLRPEMSRDADMVQRFFNEAQAATAIRNPGIVQVFDYGKAPDGRAYIVMELLEGETLSTRLKVGRLDSGECCRIGRQVANVLQAAHAAGIIHRDLKPDNLFLVPDAEVVGGERVKVLDFGIAKLAAETHSPGVHTRADVVLGTPSYMSPEQCRGGGAVDPRSDIYSLGCILFKMACGRPPFLGQGAGEIVGAHLHVPPPHPQSLAPEMPPALAALIERMLAKQPDARPQSMAAVSQELDEILRVRASTPLPALVPPPPAPMLAPAPLPEPGNFPSSTTLGGSAGMASIQARPAPRRLPFVLGGVVVLGATIAIAAVLATGDSKPSQRQISYDEIAAAPQPEPAAAAVPAPPPPPPPTQTADAAEGSAADPAIELEEPMTAGQLEAECRKHEAARKWRELEQCAGQLRSLDPARAAELKTRAQEGKAAARLASVETALRENNLKKAKAELDLVSPGASGYSKIKRMYVEAEDQAIAALAVQLDRVKDRDCEEYRELLATEQAARPPRVAAEAGRRTPCTAK
jgi:serine/threonine-protein kinase